MSFAPVLYVARSVRSDVVHSPADIASPSSVARARFNARRVRRRVGNDAELRSGSFSADAKVPCRCESRPHVVTPMATTSPPSDLSRTLESSTQHDPSSMTIFRRNLQTFRSPWPPTDDPRAKATYNSSRSAPASRTPPSGVAINRLYVTALGLSPYTTVAPTANAAAYQHLRRQLVFMCPHCGESATSPTSPWSARQTRHENQRLRRRRPPVIIALTPPRNSPRSPSYPRVPRHRRLHDDQTGLARKLPGGRPDGWARRTRRTHRPNA